MSRALSDDPRNVRKRELYQTPAWKRDRSERNLKRNYGLTHEAYDALAAAQNWSCAICEIDSWEVKRLHVDHDHDTEKVRGLLCPNCNRALGGLKDSPALAEAAAAYLRKHGKG